MTHNRPHEITREFAPQPAQSDRCFEERPAQNDNHLGDGLCPICKGYASIAPKPSEYCGKGLLRRFWLCRACGHEWATVVHVLD